MRGIGGAVVTFPASAEDSPKLWLAAEDEAAIEDGGETHAHFPITTCTTCGQHYYLANLKDFRFTGRAPLAARPGQTAHGGRRFRNPKVVSAWCWWIS